MTEDARRFHWEMAREWQFYCYPRSDGRVVALQPPPRDALISRQLVAQVESAVLATGESPYIRRDGDRIIVGVENCRAEYRIDEEYDAAFGCSLVKASYWHHTLPAR